MAEFKKILIVDDERFNINVLADLLKPSYKILAAINGQQARTGCGQGRRRLR